MAFEPIIWYGKDENGNVPDGAPAMNADNLNRIEGGIAANKELSEANKNIIDVNVLPIPLYLAFAGNANANMVTAAFGKGNEDKIKGIGKALAMYAWFKGTDKTAYPFINLQNMLTLNDMNYDVFDEIVNDTYLKDFIRGNTYASDKIGEVYSLNTYGDPTDYMSKDVTYKKSISFTVGESDLKHSFIFSSRHCCTANNYNNANFYTSINGVKLFNNSTTGSSYSNIDKNTGQVVYNWSDVDIIEPGTYTMEVGVTPTYQASSRAVTYAQAAILKAKQSYSV